MDLTGHKFGRLTVINVSHKNKCNQKMWECVCDCGNHKIVNHYDIIYGKTRSCGCLRKEITASSKTTHGYKHTRLYRVWCNIKKRCNCKSYIQYEYYGGRGIKLCEEWNNDFAIFHDWSMANGYDENAKRGECTIDRIDVNGNYEPSNCRWVSMAEQNRNKRNSRKE